MRVCDDLAAVAFRLQDAPDEIVHPEFFRAADFHCGVQLITCRDVCEHIDDIAGENGLEECAGCDNARAVLAFLRDAADELEELR